MAATAQGLKPLGGPPSTTELHRDDMVNFEPSGFAALDAAPARRGPGRPAAPRPTGEGWSWPGAECASRRPKVSARSFGLCPRPLEDARSKHERGGHVIAGCVIRRFLSEPSISLIVIS